MEVEFFNSDEEAAEALEQAMKAAADAGGNTVFMPPGNYLIKGTLDVPENVTLEGVFRAPTARTQNRGSTLLAMAGAGKADGQPFFSISAASLEIGRATSGECGPTTYGSRRDKSMSITLS